MSEINDALGADGAGHPVTVGGRPFNLSPVTQLVKAQFEAWLVAAARQEIFSEQGSVSQEVFSKMLLGFSERKAAKTYSWLGPVWQQVFPTEPGQRQMFYLLTRQFHPDLLPDEVDRLVQNHLGDVAQAVREVIEAGNPPRPPAGGKPAAK